VYGRTSIQAEEISRVNDSQTTVRTKSPGQKGTGAKFHMSYEVMEHLAQLFRLNAQRESTGAIGDSKRDSGDS
jgi:hypothetical protein